MKFKAAAVLKEDVDLINVLALFLRGNATHRDVLGVFRLTQITSARIKK